MKPSAQILRVSIACLLMLLLQSGAIFAMDAQLVYREGRVDIDRRGDVEAGGKTVSPGAEEVVEVRPGEQPCEKFDVKPGQIDYSNWRRERRFNGFVTQVNTLSPPCLSNNSALWKENGRS